MTGGNSKPNFRWRAVFASLCSFRNSATAPYGQLRCIPPAVRVDNAGILQTVDRTFDGRGRARRRGNHRARCRGGGLERTAAIYAARHVTRRKVQVRLSLGRWLALGLELPLAADIFRTAVAPSWR